MADLTIRFIGDTSGLKRSSAQAESTVKGLTGHISGLAKSVFLGNVATKAFTAGMSGLKSALKGSLDEARESVRVGKLTNAVLKSTGGVAHVTAGHVDELATALSNKIGIDDEAIAANENLLLTFTNVRNEVGKGNDIFDQATTAIQDMSVAIGQDARSSTIQLGKALNDPIKGITALRRVGVAFTQQQQDQIKTLVKSGKTLEAQKIILGELQKEFGGAAAAAADPFDRLKVTVKNLEEEVGLKFLPLLNSAATFLSNTLPGAIDWTLKKFSELGLLMNEKLRPVIIQVRKEFEKFMGTLQAHKDTILAVASALTAFVLAFVAVRKAQSGIAILQSLPAILAPLIAVIGTAGVVVALVIAAIVALGVGFFIAYKRIKPFHDLVDRIWQTMQVGAKVIWHWLQDVVVPAIINFGQKSAEVAQTVIGWFQNLYTGVVTALTPLGQWINDNVISTFVSFGEAVSAWVAFVAERISQFVALFRAEFEVLAGIMQPVLQLIGTLLRTQFAIYAAVLRAFIAVVTPIWQGLWAGIRAVVTVVLSAITNTIQVVLAVIRGVFQIFTGLLRGDWSKVWEGIKTIFVTTWQSIDKFLHTSVDTLVTFFAGIPARIIDVLAKAYRAMWGLGRDLIDAIIDGIKSGAGLIGDALKSVIPGPLRGALSHLPGSVGDFFKSANGNFLRPGQLSVVGERGPELFAPMTAGHVIPNHKLGSGGGGTTINQYITIQNNDPAAVGRALETYARSGGGARSVRSAIGAAAA